jgi:hypothetical protein
MELTNNAYVFARMLLCEGVQSLYSSLLLSQVARKEEANRHRLSLTVLFAELPAGARGKSRDPLIAGNCHLVVAAGT